MSSGCVTIRAWKRKRSAVYGSKSAKAYSLAPPGGISSIEDVDHGATTCKGS
uniref:Uncharacterized protein n=1 Tax=Nelumbo nucifera TaxID=4432 RepID=A0A822Z8P6_NELNU|nr:TPA_asm: hypothetical protein HUJ06_015551 [Nelumbo nucifera]